MYCVRKISKHKIFPDYIGHKQTGWIQMWVDQGLSFLVWIFTSHLWDYHSWRGNPGTNLKLTWGWCRWSSRNPRVGSSLAWYVKTGWFVADMIFENRMWSFVGPLNKGLASLAADEDGFRIYITHYKSNYNSTTALCNFKGNPLWIIVTCVATIKIIWYRRK